MPSHKKNEEKIPFEKKCSVVWDAFLFDSFVMNNKRYKQNIIEEMESDLVLKPDKIKLLFGINRICVKRNNEVVGYFLKKDAWAIKKLLDAENELVARVTESHCFWIFKRIKLNIYLRKR